jgi:hypothetical protein
MRLIVYINGRSCKKDALRSIIQSAEIEHFIAIFFSINTLSNFLQFSGHKDLLVLLWISSIIELNELIRFSDLYHEQKIILVLPDNKEETLFLGYRLYPRYVGYSDGNLQAIMSVLNKLTACNECYSV